MQGPLTYALREFAEGVSTRREEVVARELDILADGVEVLGPVCVTLEVARAGEEFRIRGDAELTVRQPCVSCLDPVELNLRAAITVLARMLKARENEGEGPPDGVLYHDGERFSLADEVRQSLLVEIPPHPLCAADCRGLCPRCGANRNRAACTCDASAAGDPRWAQLRSLAEVPEGAAEDRKQQPDRQTERNEPTG